GTGQKPPRCTSYPYTTLFRSMFMICPCLVTRVRSDHGTLQWTRAEKRGKEACFLHTTLSVPRAWLLPGRAVRTSFLVPVPHKIGDRKSTRLNSSHVKISYAVT